MQRNQRSNCQHLLDHRKSKEIKGKKICFCFIDYAKAFDCVEHNKLWKILKQMGIPDHLTCLLTNLYAGQETTVRTGHGWTGSKLGKEYIKAVYCHPTYLTYAQNTSWETLGWMKAKAGIKIAGRNNNNLRYANDTTLMAESEEELSEEPLNESERGQWKSWLKTQHSEK